LSVPQFRQNYGVKIGGCQLFIPAFPGGADPSSEGVPTADGLLVSTSLVVSATDSIGLLSLLFTTGLASPDHLR